MARLAVIALFGLAGLLAFARPARAENHETVALLPFDADPKLAIYGQPVASEIARALVAGTIDVVVVGPKMAVPERAKLIVDGNIAGKGETIVLTVRVRNRLDGVTLAQVQSTASSLANIDKAAADVSARVLPAVREKLAALGKPEVAPLPPTPPPRLPTVEATAPTPMLLGLAAHDRADEPFRAALAATVQGWATQHQRTVVDADPNKLARKLATATVKASGHQLGMLFEVLAYDVRGDKVPMARARVRVRISDAVGVVFDRVITTDTVVGDRAMAADAVATRTAREVLAILRPHVARVVPAWR